MFNLIKAELYKMSKMTSIYISFLIVPAIGHKLLINLLVLDNLIVMELR